MSEKEYFIELHLKEINDKLDRIDKRLDKLEEHINFINSVYSDLKNHQYLEIFQIILNK